MLRATLSVLALVAGLGALLYFGKDGCPHMRAKAQLQANVALFESWSDTHDKEYSDEDEKTHRMHVWMENNARIQEHNNQVPAPSFTLGHNEFSDMTQEEFHAQFNLGKYSGGAAAKKAQEDALSIDPAKAEVARKLSEMDPVELPDHVNWLAMGAVTPVKNQGACGACWAFSTTGALEGAHWVKTGELVSLSEQNLLDCDHKDLGCSGGLMDNAFKFDEKSGGLCSEADYPYKARRGTCNSTCTDVPGSIVKDFVDVPPGSEKALRAAITMQPVSIALQADQFVFQFYKGGILDDDSCGRAGNIDHGVLAAGFGTDPETQTPFWLVKNSWGATWGDKGYLRIARNSTNEYGMCAILKMASLPILA